MENQQEGTAESVINTTVESVDGASVIIELSRKKEMLVAEERTTVQQYIDAMRPVYAAMVVDNLGGTTAGLYDGSSIYVDQQVLMVGDSVDQTIAQAQEVQAHEQYHQANDHTAPLHVMADTRSDIALVMGGVEYTETGLIEGLTVLRTGDQFVSAEYVVHKNSLLSGMQNAGLSVSDVESAVNQQHDVTLIDDRAQGNQTQSNHALAA